MRCTSRHGVRCRCFTMGDGTVAVFCSSALPATRLFMLERKKTVPCTLRREGFHFGHRAKELQSFHHKVKQHHVLSSVWGFLWLRAWATLPPLPLSSSRTSCMSGRGVISRFGSLSFKLGIHLLAWALSQLEILSTNCYLDWTVSPLHTKDPL